MKASNYFKQEFFHHFEQNQWSLNAMASVVTEKFFSIQYWNTFNHSLSFHTETNFNLQDLKHFSRLENFLSMESNSLSISCIYLVKYY